ncbi:MAG: lipopolysaccharide heptosyltransferase II [Syntrophorhabdales bacterium]
MTGKTIVYLPNWLGDMVMATPFLASLRKPLEGELWAIGQSKAMHLYDGLGLFDRFIPNDSKDLISFLDKVSMLRALKFDQGIVLPHSFRAALLFFLGAVQNRIGYRLNNRGFMLTRPLGRETELVATAEQYLRILDALGAERSSEAPSLRVTEDEEQRFDSKYTDVGGDYVAFVVGAQYGPSKRWPASHFSELAGMIVSKYSRMIYILPGKQEMELARRVRDDVPNKEKVRIEVMDIADLKVCLSRASLVVSNDTGPRHMAEALGRPTIVILGPMDTKYTEYPSRSTYPVFKDVTCRPCNKKKCEKNHECMTGIRAQDVFAKVEEILG